MFKTDVLIIGSGIAGLSAALKLASSFQITLITKREALESNTRYAQGGIASVTSSLDNIASHIEDTMAAGAGLCHKEVVEKIVSDGPRFIEELVQLGVRFTKADSENFDLGQEGGHTQRRVLHSGDLTGAEIERALLDRVRKNSNIRILEYHLAIDLITTQKFSLEDSNRCVGAYVLDRKKMKIEPFLAKTTLLATGGIGKVYLYTSNPDIATGDGIAMAYRAGAIVANLEFVQFHPTCLYNPGAFSPKNQSNANLGKTFLVSEAVRGEGAKLKLATGESFMKNYDDREELAPRDIVSRAIDFEMKRRGDSYVLLDISHKSSDFIKDRFPNIYKTCLAFGFDLTEGPIPVVPAAHYLCGGIQTTPDGQTNIPGLYAIGETACTGFHGANRLASNSLLEGVAMADYVRQAVSDFIKDSSDIPEKIPEWNSGRATDSDEAVVITQNWDEIRRLLWNYVGIVRSNKRLDRAKRRIDILQEEIREYYWNFKVTPDLIELRNIACVAELIVHSAMKRKESRGLHYNRDYPVMNDSSLRDTLLHKNHP